MVGLGCVWVVLGLSLSWVGVGLGTWGWGKNLSPNNKIGDWLGGWLAGWLDPDENNASLALTHRFFPQGRVWQLRL